MAHTEVKVLLVQDVVQRIGVELGVDEETALDLWYTSRTASCLSDDETGLYGDSALSILSCFCDEKGVTMTKVFASSQGD